MCLLSRAELVGLSRDVDHLLYGDGQHESCDPEKALLLKEAQTTISDDFLDLEPKEILSLYLG